MKYAIFDESAIDELISNQRFQSFEFETAKILHSLLSSGDLGNDLNSKFVVVDLDKKQGIAICTKDVSKSSQFLVIDLESSNLFCKESELEPVDEISTLQKSFRLAKKIWSGNSVYSKNEYVDKSTSKAILSMSNIQGRKFQVLFDNNPANKPLKSEKSIGKFLLLHNKRFQENLEGIGKENVNLTNFNRAQSQIPEIVKVSKSSSDNKKIRKHGKVFSDYKLTEGGENYIHRNRSFKKWMKKLTETQKEFVDSEITGAQRLQGAAGTGKTLCLILKAISYLQMAERRKQPKKVLFVSYSQSSKHSILSNLNVMDKDGFVDKNPENYECSLNVCTLAELCGTVLREEISEVEFIDGDELESRNTQLLYVHNSFLETMSSSYKSHEPFLSEKFKSFINQTTEQEITQMLQHEISVLIKGRASENFDVYKEIPGLKYGIPTENESDKGFIFTIFKKYQEQLSSYSQFDIDDVVLTAIGQLDTPVWRRRRIQEGFDAIFIDETHLFNINELHVFHYLTRDANKFPIVFAIDLSQSVGDQGWTYSEITDSLIRDDSEPINNNFNTVFRSSSEITELAYSIVSSGATLFSNFDNPLKNYTSGLTSIQEEMCAKPSFRSYANDKMMVAGAFARAKKMSEEMKCAKGGILIVGFDQKLFKQLQDFAKLNGISVTDLKARGDIESVEQAIENDSFVLGHSDFVGGLEFAGVVAVGVDMDRFPPKFGETSIAGKNFLSYSYHNRLYVAVSRAKYRMEMLGLKNRGPSEIILPAVESELVKVIEE